MIIEGNKYMGKGSSFEREISKQLSLWWSEGKRDDIFYRSHSSGARFTQRKKIGKTTAYQAGDITCSDPEGEMLIKNWNIECKTGYGSKTKSGINRWDILDFVDSKQKIPILQQMWNQCKRDAEITNREPVLIFRRNNRLSCIMMSIYYKNKLVNYYGNSNCYAISIAFSENVCVIMNLDDFFYWISDIGGFLTQECS